MILTASIGFFLFLGKAEKIEIIIPNSYSNNSLEVSGASSTQSGNNQIINKPAPKLTDIENQKTLVNPPEIIKAIYLTSWSAGNSVKIKYLIDFKKTTEINAVIIDLKDYSGYVAYNIQVPEVEKYEAKEIRIPFINRLIKQLHNEGIYVIGRITVFQDPRLSLARPDLTVKSKKTGDPWLDNKKLSWVDPAAKEAWDYNIAIAKETVSRGFDELNFDYIRFPSDDDLNDMSFPFWQKTRTDADFTQTNADTNAETKSEVMRNFFKYLREQLPGVKISADLFGLTTINQDDLGIGQVLENAYAYFDYVCPMVYPSHYASEFLGYKNPALYPYEVVKCSMENAIKRLERFRIEINNSTSTEFLNSKFYIPNSKLRPWLQDFDLGADYNAEVVGKEIQAVYDAATSTPELLNGWMLWNPSNIYSF